MKKVISSPLAPAAVGPYSQAIQAGDTLYVSGQLPIDAATGKFPEGGVKEQTEQVCKNVKALLEASGTSIEKVVKTTCFLADMADFAVFNEIYAGYFTGKPARSCVAAKTLPKGALVEVDTVCLL